MPIIVTLALLVLFAIQPNVLIAIAVLGDAVVSIWARHTSTMLIEPHAHSTVSQSKLQRSATYLLTHIMRHTISGKVTLHRNLQAPKAIIKHDHRILLVHQQGITSVSSCPSPSPLSPSARDRLKRDEAARVRRAPALGLGSQAPSPR